MSSRSPALAILLVIAGIVFIGIAVFYATTDTSLLAASVARHYKHAVAAAVVAVLCFIGANFARRRSVY